MLKNLEQEKELAAKEAVKLINDGMIVGLGTGSTAFYAIKEIANLVKNGLKIKAVPTSKASEALALSLNIPLIDINDIESIDITIDGADEFTEDLILIKGGGGALLREKIVASLTNKEIIIADSAKKVNQLGKFKVPVEVIPFAKSYVSRELLKLGGTSYLRQTDNKTFITDSGNYILDTDFGLIDNPVKLANDLSKITGLVCHGIFINLTKMIIMGKDDKFIVYNLHHQ